MLLHLMRGACEAVPRTGKAIVIVVSLALAVAGSVRKFGTGYRESNGERLFLERKRSDQVCLSFLVDFRGRTRET